jgi:hypothetical protein
MKKKILKIKKNQGAYVTHPIPKEHVDDDRRPLSAGFLMVSIIGFFISLMYTLSGRFDIWFRWAGENSGYTWGFLLMLFFLMMFIAAVASITPRGKDL